MPYLNLFKKKFSGSETFSELQTIYERENLFFPKGWLKSEQCENYLVENVIYADYLSQITWALENGRENIINTENFLDEVLIEQISAFKADIVFFNTGAMYRVDRKLRNQIRNRCKTVKFITGSWGDELPKDETYHSYLGDLDLIFSCTLGYFQDMRNEGLSTSYLPSSFNEYVDYKKTVKNIDVCFIGTTGYLELDHFERYKKLDRIFFLLKEEKIKFSLVTKEKTVGLLTMLRNSTLLALLAFIIPTFQLKIIIKIARFLRANSTVNWLNSILKYKSYGIKLSTLFRILSSLSKDKISYYLRNGQLSKKYKSFYKKPYLYVSEYYSALSNSKIVLNLHRDEDNDFGNIRCFEATGVGSCLLTDRAEKLSNLFNVGTEIIGFSTPEECVIKIKNLLADPLKLSEISLKSQLRVQNEHLQAHRDRTIMDGFASLLANNSEHTALHNYIYIYDLRRYPLSYDYAFFLQYCYIKNRNFKSKISVNIVLPKLEQISQEFDWTAEEFMLRKTRIIDQLNSYFTDFEFFETIDCYYEGKDYLPGIKRNELPHHSEYYNFVNQNSNLTKPLLSRADSVEYVKEWQKLECVKSYVTFTIRESKVSKERNTDITLVKRLAKHFAASGFMSVVIPDTNSLQSLNQFSGEHIKYFREAAYDFDLRLAMYENASINFFNNNGPCIAAGLDPKVRYLLTKLVVPTVPHCTIEFIERQGFKYGTTPSYSKKSIWLWEEEDLDLIIKNATKLIK